MKFLWILIPVILVIVVLQIPFHLKSPKPIELSVGKVNVTVRCKSMTVRASGSVMIDSITVQSKKSTITVSQMSISGSIFKLLELRKSEMELKKYLKELQFDSLETAITRGGFRSILLHKCSGSFEKTDLRTKEISIHKQLGSVSGSISGAASKIMGKPVENQSISFKISEGKVDGEQKGSFAGGSIKSNFTFDLHSKKLTSVDLSGKNVDIQKLLPYPFTGTTSITFKGTLSDSAPLVGSGKVVVEKFVDKNSDLLYDLRQTLKRVGVEQVKFDKVTVPFTLKKEIIQIDSLKADGKLFDVTGSGTIRLKTISYSLAVTGYLANSMEPSVSKTIWGGLDPDPKNGGKKFTGTVNGTKENYSVEVDRRFIRQSVKSFFHNLFN